MHVLMLGLSHVSTPVAVREQASMNLCAIPSLLGRLLANPHVLEAVILSTCNRTELYAVVETLDAGKRTLAQFLCAETGLSEPTVTEHVEYLDGDDAMLHLFRVTAGLESLVLGEGQILGQVKDAHGKALECGGAGAILDHLFRAAITAGKRARTETEIARGAVSISSAAVELARQALGNLQGRSILLLGAGKMSKLAAKQFTGDGINRIIVANRTVESAEELAVQVGGETIPWIELGNCLEHVDVVLCSTGAPHHVIALADVERLLRKRVRPLLLIDISVPRNLDPKLRQLSCVTLFDIDDLQAVAGRNRAEREGVVDEVMGILDAEYAEFQQWVRNFRMTPMITSLRQQIEGLRDSETQRFRAKHGDAFSTEQQRLIDELTQSLINKILHQPTSELKRMNPVQQERHALALKQLFDLKVENLDEHYRRKITERRNRQITLKH